MHSHASKRKDLGAVIGTWLGLVVLWTIFVGHIDTQELVGGAIASAFVALIAANGRGAAWVAILSPRRLLFFFAFLVYLAVAIVKSNLQMAAIVSRPALAIRPGIVRVKTRLKSPLGRLVLANAITLTPGTLTVDADGEDLFIHWVTVEAEDIDEATRQIVTGFERYLEVIFG